ncbi:ATP-binding protein [Geobacter sp.]|uniref:sensor histidine kinase n=1 Tax=Geobacter sp. TaxID=46610 RepID=UPI0026106351|nr:ATP-binding protein [Geobacter sp.]
MNLRRPGRRVTLLVWLVVTIGLVAGIVTNGYIGMTLLELNREQLRLMEQESRLEQAALQLRRLGQEAQSGIRTLLQLDLAPAPADFPAAEFTRALAEFRQTRNLPEKTDLAGETEAAAGRLHELWKRAAAWRKRYAGVYADSRQSLTLNRVRESLHQLRSAMETLEGRRRLREAQQLRRWRHSGGSETSTLAATILTRQSRPWTRVLNEIKTELVDLSRLVEMLSGESELDQLADLRDNQLKPGLERLEQQLAVLRADGRLGSEELPPGTVETLKTALFGTGYAILKEYQTVRPGEGGLFQLAHSRLILLREREALQAAALEAYQRLDSIQPRMTVLTRERGRKLAEEAERSLRESSRNLLALSLLTLGGFLGLGGLISRMARQSYAQLDALNRSLEEKVTERTRLLEDKNRELVRTQEELVRKEQLAAVGSLAAGVAHEINNPAAIIRGNGEILRRRLATGGAEAEEIGEILKQTERISRITQGLLVFARAQDLQQNEVPLHPLLDEILAQAPHQVPLGNIQVVRRFADDLPPLTGDREKLRQVFTNLVLNALQAMDGAGTLTVATRRQERVIDVTVADTGPGIPPDLRARIFNPFFTTKRSGTGLGLSVSYGIVQALGGSIEVESAEGVGTTFTVLLPLRKGGRNN